ncbi:hypothetical protein GCM10009716_30000 [Streptomyces sodiiphilus]|uniref:PAS domain-containing protein n=2 Tax=Streptomyces sodiiphilus TaxID=226217 RepID=A0ABN2PER3_9ACTN
MDREAREAVPGMALRALDDAPVAVAVTWGSGHAVLYTNKLCRAVTGDRPPGSFLGDFFPDLPDDEYLDRFTRVLAGGGPLPLSDEPVVVRRPGDGEREVFFDFTLSPVAADATGQVGGVLVIGVDVTERVAAADRVHVLAEERRRTVRRFESLLATSMQTLWVTDPEGRVIERSPAWERVTGQTWEELRGHGWLEAVHPHDRDRLSEAWFHALRSPFGLFEEVYRLRLRDGSYRHYLLRAVPVRENGTVVEWAVACTDHEDQWLQDRRNDLLARAATVVTHSQSVQDACAAVIEIIVPELADAGGIYLLPDPSEQPLDDGTVVFDRVASAVRPGLPPGLPTAGEERMPPESVFAQVFRERRPAHAKIVPEEIPESLAPPSTVPWLKAAGAHSAAVLPVLVDGAVAAIVTAVVAGDRPPISSDDIVLMRELVEHAPLAHAVRLHRTQRVSLALQHSLLTDPPRVPGLEIVARYLPSPAAPEVGGDWYDSFVLPNGVTTLIIGDVAGHDLGAAVTMSKLRNMLRGLAADRQEPPGDILRRLDKATQTLDPEEATATCILGLVEGRPGEDWRLRYSVAGHPPPLLVTEDGRTRYLEDAMDVLLGLARPDQRPSTVEPLPPGSTVLLFTDGLVEHPGEHLDRGLSRLSRQASALATAPLAAFCDTLLAESDVTGRDDIAVIAARVPARPFREADDGPHA